MAIDMSGESSSPLTSPRISFSYDLHQPDDDHDHDHDSLQGNNPYRESRDSLDNKCLDDDFDFCINGGSSSTAEDLFLDGKIRSLQDKSVISKHESLLPIFESQDHHSFPIPPLKGISNPDYSNETARPRKNLDPEKSSNINQSKIIKRSSSLHCDHTHRKSSFWFSLPLLSRSNSTGSVPKVVKESQNQNPKSKNLKNSTDLIPASSSSSYRKPPLRKHYVGGYRSSNGMRINPVINVPPPKITGNLFGFGAIFGSGDKVKKIKK